jgi:PAS domain S-box-containing protein
MAEDPAFGSSGADSGDDDFDEDDDDLDDEEGEDDWEGEGEGEGEVEGEGGEHEGYEMGAGAGAGSGASASTRGRARVAGARGGRRGASSSSGGGSRGASATGSRKRGGRSADDKVIRRRELNRRNARKSRLRKKEFVDQLHGRLYEVESDLATVMAYLSDVVRVDPNDVLQGKMPAPSGAGKGKRGAAGGAGMDLDEEEEEDEEEDEDADIITPATSSSSPPSVSDGSTGGSNGEKGSNPQPPGREPIILGGARRFGSRVATAPAASSSSSSSSSSGAAANVASSSSASASASASSAGPSSSSSTLGVVPTDSEADEPLGIVLSRVPEGLPPPRHDLIRMVGRVRDSFVISDPALPDMPIVWASPGFLHLTGYEYQEVVGKNCRMLQTEGTDKTIVRALGDALHAAREFSCVILNQRKDGALFWNALTVSPLFDGDGKVLAIVGIQANVSPGVLPRDRIPEDVADLAKEEARKVLGVIQTEHRKEFRDGAQGEGKTGAGAGAGVGSGGAEGSM